ncbi:hypothetical protein SPAR_00989 [Streptomyces sparsogenes DSM 40356]|uniref:Uncharacterized protein n=1 Tax=Streptomyces sparsogenes DSM 40356 TaxID=1331668 RepID=A0A1R1ST74_9ACTN|nr:hypothetical protein SPAR_00989 [Streptomyces sparsogenes DSM 40356]
MTAGKRQHCTCVEVQNLDYDEAAAALKIKRRWLEDNISRLPHQKYGHNPAVFCHCDLRLIMRMRTVIPSEALHLLDQTTLEAAHAPAITPTVRSLASIKPARGSTRRGVAQT